MAGKAVIQKPIALEPMFVCDICRKPTPKLKKAGCMWICERCSSS